MAFLKRSNLRQLIMVLALLSTLVTVINMFITSSNVQKQALIDSTLQNNQAYATKLADSTQIFLENTQLELRYSAEAIAKHWGNKTYLTQEMFRISKHNQVFNAVVIVNAKGIIIDSTKAAVDLAGNPLTTAGTVQSLKSRRPIVSQPYHSALNNLVIMISHPIFDEKRTYLGFIAGTIYLKEKNILNRLLGEHYYEDGSYIYVVDQSKRLLFHPNPDKLGKVIHANSIINNVMDGQSGQMRTHNSDGIEMLSGYAPIPAADWGVVSQRPIKSTLEAHDGLMQRIIFKSLPINLLMLAFIWFCSLLISNPLRQLARNAKNMRKASTINHVQGIKAWYFEASELKTAFLFGLQSVQDQVGKLRQDIRTDPLTGLDNRRTLEFVLNQYTNNQTPFSVITLDIDHFKQVNDSHGHDVGDTVLQQLATIMKTSSRQQDYCIRVGGEEFAILLPNCPLQIAAEIAERLRLNVATFHFPIAGQLTISLGVAEWPLHGQDTAAVLKLADKMLYAAKQGGRNQTQVAPLPTLLR